MAYTVYFTPTAARTLEGLDKSIRLRIVRRIESLALDPRPADVKMLKGGDGDLRIRVGDYRIVYRVDHGRLIVVIIRIGHRRDVYRTK